MRIAISGPPGSGKTTVGELVADRMGFELVLVGQLFRQMAVERNMDLAAFGRLAEENETIDRELDDRTVAVAREREDIVIEGRLTGALLKQNGIDALSVLVDATEDVRCSRIAKREEKPAEVVLDEMRRREQSERKRYLAYYGIDPSDSGIYDLCIDSSSKPPEEIADAIIAEAERRYAD